MMVHDLKTHPDPFAAVLDGRKRFEYRRNDRGFGVGDVLVLREWDPDRDAYTGREIRARVHYIARDPAFGVPDGFAVLSIAVEVVMPTEQAS